MIDTYDARIRHLAVLARAAADKIRVILKPREPVLGFECAINGGQGRCGVARVISGEVEVQDPTVAEKLRDMANKVGAALQEINTKNKTASDRIQPLLQRQ